MSWKEKIFDDAWKYLIGLAGGSSITGYLLKELKSVPTWAWISLFVITLMLLGILIYFGYPSLISKWQKRRTLVYWRKIKSAITIYHESNTLDGFNKKKLEDDYVKYREKLSDICSKYHLEIQNYLTEKYKNRGNRSSDLVFNNFKNCFSSSSLENWRGKCSRKIPDELDVFDNLAREIVNLKIEEKVSGNDKS